MPTMEKLELTKDILGYSIEARGIKLCTKDIARHIDERGTVTANWLACINPHSYATAKTDRQFSDALNDATWLVPDGVGIILAGRVLGSQIPERITGFDVFDAIMKHLNETGGSVFFLGSSEENLCVIQQKVAVDFPRIASVGSYSPPFKEAFSTADNELMIEVINAARPDVVWVGMTAPKQEKWIFANRNRLDVKFIGAIGAVFDFYSGKVRRSHPIFRSMGLEWLPRLIRQPSRLWRRTLVSAPVFIRDTASAALGRGHDN